MNDRDKNRIECAIRHIESSLDVDPWACEIAVEAMKKQLPSAQPEIIRCNDCMHRGEKPIADGRYWCEIHDTFMYYCSDAERRTDE